MKVMFADKLAVSATDALTSDGFDLVVEPTLSGDALVDALVTHDPEVLVVRSTKVQEAHLAAARSLALVIRAGAGVNTIDLEAAGRLGVFVANCPGKNAVAVAELTFALLLAVDRHVADCVVDARAGVWNKASWSKADGVRGKTLGILGMGSIGQEVAARAKAFGMPVVAWSRSLTPARAAELGVAHAATPLDVAKQADVLSLHLAATADTKHLVDAAMLAALPEGAIVLNTSRCEVVDEAALLDAIETRGLRAGLDVVDGEPAGKTGTFEHPLAVHPNVVLTHHIGASTNEAQEAVAAEVVRLVRGYRTSGRSPNVVNLETRTRATHHLVVRHRDRVGVLAGVLDALRQAGLNVQEMENILFAGGEAAVARIQVAGDPSSVLGAIGAVPDVLHVHAIRL